VPKGTVFYKGKGCDACRKTGYSGRMGVTEVLEVTDDVRSKLLNGASSDDIKEFVKKHQGMKTLFDDAMDKCIAGQTTLDEVFRITSNE
jgi:type II secretory ATPase GspE/PulE/Tfp pilus assembly ATPase PilB-like protein